MNLKVNGQSIDEGVIEAEFVQIKTHYERMGNVSCCERDDEFRGYARENIIGRVLLLQESRRRIGPLQNEEVDSAMAEVEQKFGGRDAMMLSLGATIDQLPLIRNDVEADLRVKKMVDELCGREGEIDSAVLEKYYGEHLDQFLTAEQVRASHILKSVRRVEERGTAFATLREVRQKLLAGEDFETLARAHSDRAEDHIDLGFFKRGELPEELETIAFSSNVGEVSPIFLSTYGYHLLKVTDRKPAEPKPFESIVEEVREHYLAHRRSELTAKLVDELKKTAVIEEEPATV